jgi:predicted RNA binding protein YcfA (HicA-like mRNA interferase family)
MEKLRSLSGKDLLSIFSSFGFHTASQRGSHIKLRRRLPDGRRQTLTIVRHDEVDKGTLRAIYSQALRYIPETDLRSHFYTD